MGQLRQDTYVNPILQNMPRSNTDFANLSPNLMNQTPINNNFMNFNNSNSLASGGSSIYSNQFNNNSSSSSGSVGLFSNTPMSSDPSKNLFMIPPSNQQNIGLFNTNAAPSTNNGSRFNNNGGKNSKKSVRIS